MTRGAVALAAAAAALVVFALVAGGDGEPSLPEDVPPIEEPEARDPGGDARADVRLPPDERWFGFNGAYFTRTGSHPQLDQGLTAERTAGDAAVVGVNSARVDLSWWDLEPESGRLSEDYAEEIDAFVESLERRGGRVLFVLTAVPPWAAVRAGDPGSPPRDDEETVEAFARMAAFVAGRWPSAVAIETWNEPNGIFTWGSDPDPETYTRFHRAAARAIREATPQIAVLLGGLAAVVDDPRFMRPQAYLKRMYAAGLQPGDYDGLALHPYPRQGSMERLSGGAFARGFEDFRLGHAWRDPDPPLWVTETGSTTSGPSPLSPEDQARRTLQLVRKLLTAPRVRGVYLHTQYELESAPPSSPERGFGVLESQAAAPGRPKPAFCALRMLVREPPPFAGCGAEGGR